MSKKNKTTQNETSVFDFLNSVKDEQKREDSFKVLEMMQKISGEQPKMWGTSIVGFGSYWYKYKSGREGEYMRIGFSPRKTSLTLYIMPGFESYSELLKDLGKHKIGKSCLYLKKLEDIQEDVLKNLIASALQYMDKKYPK